MKQWDELIRRFDRDWEETGPLIEKFVIELTAFPGGWRATAWRPFAIPQTVTRADGTTALEAVCRLIVELGRAGKLAP
jgi:hypothetical protein